MIKRSYIVGRDCEVGKRGFAINDREKKGKPFFTSRDEWSAQVATDWEDWTNELVQFITHIYPYSDVRGKILDVVFAEDRIVVSENDRHFTNTRQDM